MRDNQSCLALTCWKILLFLHLSLCDCQLLFLSKITRDVIVGFLMAFLGNVNNGPGTVY